MLNAPVQYVTFVSKGPNGVEEKRDIAMINGIAFYKSTGNNSGSSGTWLPFAGIDPTTGVFIKPGGENGRPKRTREMALQMLRTDYNMFENRDFSSTVSDDLKKAGVNSDIVLNFAKAFKSQVKGLGFSDRFFGIEPLLQSSILGGGIWDKPEGKALKAELQKCYPTFYQENSISLRKSPVNVDDTVEGRKAVNTFLKINVEQYYVPNQEIVPGPSQQQQQQPPSLAQPQQQTQPSPQRTQKMEQDPRKEVSTKDFNDLNRSPQKNQEPKKISKEDFNYLVNRLPQKKKEPKSEKAILRMFNEISKNIKPTDKPLEKKEEKRSRKFWKK